MENPLERVDGKVPKHEIKVIDGKKTLVVSLMGSPNRLDPRGLLSEVFNITFLPNVASVADDELRVCIDSMSTHEAQIITGSILRAVKRKYT